MLFRSVTGKIARWQMLLSEYDIVFKAQKAIRGSAIADHLAYQPLDDYQPIKFDYLDEEVMYLKSRDYEEPLIGEGPAPIASGDWSLMALSMPMAKELGQ